MRLSICLLLCAAFHLICATARAADQDTTQPAESFTSLFDGKDLTGWRGRKQDYSPYEEAMLSPQADREARAQWNQEMARHWRVDADKGEIVSDGQGVYLTTDSDYGDFELTLDWLMVSHNGDSGVYLRSCPQVQIWDPENDSEIRNGAQKGSGALWNNSSDNPGKWPLLKADKPVGEWNSLRIKMIGSRVWVWLNGQATVEGQILDNYFDRSRPVPPRGPIELQTHGSEMRFRHISIRPIPASEANETLEKLVGEDGYKSIFNGKDFTGWAGPVDQYEVKDGSIACRPNQGGTIHTIEEFTDFEVKVEFRLPPAGNNGLAIRYPGDGDTAYVGMCELQILDDTAPQYRSLDPRQTCGSVYGVVAAHVGYLHPVGEWNFEHTIIKGHTIKVELNGTVITDTDVSKIAPPYMHNSDHPGLMRLKGTFGFAGHSDPVQFRNIWIKPLEPGRKPGG